MRNISTNLSVALCAAFRGYPATAKRPAPLRIGRTAWPKTNTARSANLDRDSAFRRVLGQASAQAASKSLRANRAGARRVSRFSETVRVAVASQAQSIGAGGGDINEVEPNDSVAQEVSLAVNVFGEVRLNGDVDFFAFQALAGEQITVEPFAARLRRSRLIADIGLFAATGELLADVATKQRSVIRSCPKRSV